MKRILLVLALGIAASAQSAPKSAAIKTDIAPTAPRYQLFVNPNVRADLFLLDTVTGKVWVHVTFTDLVNDPAVWLAEDRIETDQDLEAFVKKHMSKKDAKAIEDSK